MEYENTLDELMRYALYRRVYPSHPSLFVNTGGMLKEVRDLCSLERVREYHKKYYHVSSFKLSFASSKSAFF